VRNTTLKPATTSKP